MNDAPVHAGCLMSILTCQTQAASSRAVVANSNSCKRLFSQQLSVIVCHVYAALQLLHDHGHVHVVVSKNGPN